MFLKFTEKPPNWSTILKKLQLTTNIDFYQMFYQPLIHDRIKSIVKSSWSTTVLTTENELSKLLDADDNNWSGIKFESKMFKKKK